ncbi:STK35 [Branchiostoma lanceolatum]|uniref:STK35 protein n=1 Tax=Branchiostoma lanceolatum TaxID=7740 RepID=A0A8K0EQL6_BRALA|nr:STK35 [Branchiostoma lanceolatum]
MEKYTNLQELGQGAFGKVYKADREEDCSTHALKCLTVDSIDKGQVVLKEIHALQQVGEHPNILQFTEVFTENGLNTPVLTVWLVMDYCSGGTLDGFISNHNPDRATVLQLLCGTAEGVAYLHGRNVVHGALKPDNILVDNFGKLPIVKIADFGIVRVCEQGGWDISNYHRQTANGTRMYLSPEIIIGVLAQRPHLVRYTAKADVFALGLIIVVILESTCTDPAISSTDPAVSSTDPAVPGTDPAKTGKLVPAVYENGQPAAMAEVMVAHPGYPVADMLMRSEPPGSPVKALVLSMLETYPYRRPTSKQVLGRLREITGSSDGTNIQAVPPRPSYTAVEVPAEDAGTSSLADSCGDDCTCSCCCMVCWTCKGRNKWYDPEGKGCVWQLLLMLIRVGQAWRRAAVLGDISTYETPLTSSAASEDRPENVPVSGGA